MGLLDQQVPYPGQPDARDGRPLALTRADFVRIAEHLELLRPLGDSVTEVTVSGHLLTLSWQGDPRDAGWHAVTSIRWVA